MMRSVVLGPFRLLARIKPGLRFGNGLQLKAEEALLRRARMRLMLWYLGVLAGALTIFGVSLYAVVHHSILEPLDQRLANSTHHIGVFWRKNSDTVSCPPLSQRQLFGVTYWACFSIDGTLIAASDPGAVTADFYDRPLVLQAAQLGTATGTVSNAFEAGPMEMRAQRFARLKGRGPLGIVLVGVPVESVLNALNVLAERLLEVGLLIFVCAVLGSMLLVNRTLAPLRAAFVRQQTFIAHASHELRTPLTLLRADADVLLRSRHQLTAEDALLLEDIATEATHMSVLASNLLELARLDAGKLPLDEEVLDVGDLLGALVRRVNAYAESHAVTVSATEERGLMITGDRVLLEQALLSLLDNAVKYNRPGGTVAVRAERSPDSRNAVQIAIVDTGIGINAADLPHLGERFFRVDKSRSRETGGTGLGLSIAVGIIRNHGGKIHFSSNTTAGTTVRVTLNGAAVRPRVSEGVAPADQGALADA